MHGLVGQSPPLRRLRVLLAAVLICATGLLVAPTAARPATAALPEGFVEVNAFTGLTQPTVVKFAADGRVFVAEKSGLIKVFDNLSDTTATTFADLRTNVYNFWDRGLLGLALHPNFPTTPYVYVLYTYDALIGGVAPRWGTPGATSDPCPTPPGPTDDGCVVSGRLSRLQAAGNVTTGAEQVLIEDWCQQYPSHSIGALAFGADGMLYVSGGDGASFNFVDYGQEGNPVNPCGDPGGSAPVPPSAEGGALRSQDLRTTGDPVSLDGTVLRVDPNTGAGVSGNPLFASADPNARRIVATGLRNPFRIAQRPGTNEMWIGDVGWNDWEEINRLTTPADGTVDNFGWPCYEGPGRQQGYDSTNLAVCETLYSAGPSAVASPLLAYHHNNAVVPGDGCPTGGSSVSGLAFAFYQGGPYPAEYDGSLFFSDYSRRCIWVMTKGADGAPNPGAIRPFHTPANGGPVNLEVSPAGELYYPGFDDGTVKRIRYIGTSTINCGVGEFKAEYYSGTTLGTTPLDSRCEPAVDHDWGMSGPGNGVPDDQFSARWTGTHEFAAGTYTFTATADDGIRVFVDGSILIDQWRDQSPTTFTATRTLTAGRHEVRVEYYENGGGAVAKVGWTGSGGVDACPTGEFRAQYHTGTTLAGTPVLSRCEAEVNYDWGLSGPGGGVPVDLFSARWTGTHEFAAGTYTFTATADDGIRVFVDGSILIDQWRDQSPTTYTATRTLTAGQHEVRVEYYENGGGAVAKVNWAASGGGAPTATIDTPAAGTRWKVGDVISFTGQAVDPEQGTLPASALSWDLVMQHCPSTCHAHPLQSYPGVVGGSFTAPDHDYPSHLELKLTATDAQGNTHSVTRRLDPSTVDVTFQSDPPGLALTVGASTGTSPFTRTVIVGSANSVTANSPQAFGGQQYDFLSWSDGGAQTHQLVAPAAARTYTASYAPSATVYQRYAWINFQPARSPVPAGYTPDSGAVYGARNGLTYGWNLDNKTARDRDSSLSPDQRYDTLINLQQPKSFRWEIGVPNGRYRVRVVAGDPAAFDSVYRVEVEGVPVFDMTASSSNRWADGTVLVDVADGRVTLTNGGGAVNNKLAFVEIARVL